MISPTSDPTVRTPRGRNPRTGRWPRCARAAMPARFPIHRMVCRRVAYRPRRIFLLSKKYAIMVPTADRVTVNIMPNSTSGCMRSSMVPPNRSQPRDGPRHVQDQNIIDNDELPEGLRLAVFDVTIGSSRYSA